MSIIRTAQPSDKKCLRELFRIVRDAVEDKFTFSWSDSFIDDELNLSSFYISESTDRIIQAFICYRISSDGVDILALGAHPNASGSGVMRNLLSEFVQMFSKEVKPIFLEVHEKNDRALALYKQNGFKTLRLRKAYYGDGGDAVVMKHD